MLSQKLGGRESRKYSGGFSGGKSSRNWQLTDEPWFKPERLLALGEAEAVIRHPRFTGRPFLRRLPFTAFTQANSQRGKAA